jgi:hypothetical protein
MPTGPKVRLFTESGEALGLLDVVGARRGDEGHGRTRQSIRRSDSLRVRGRNHRSAELEREVAHAGADLALAEDATLEQIEATVEKLRQVLQRQELEPEDWALLRAVLRESPATPAHHPGERQLLGQDPCATIGRAPSSQPRTVGTSRSAKGAPIFRGSRCMSFGAKAFRDKITLWTWKV